jgi:hypothetical protein
VFSTAHKAKGLEFDTVRIGEDFLSDYTVGELSKFCMVCGQCRLILHTRIFV